MSHIRYFSAPLSPGRRDRPELFAALGRGNANWLTGAEGTSRRCVCFAAGFGLGWALKVVGTGYRGDRSPVVYGPVGISAVAMWRIKAASGHAAAKARRTAEAISTTRAPSFKSRRRMVLNSAVASACALGLASRTVSMSQ